MNSTRPRVWRSRAAAAIALLISLTGFASTASASWDPNGTFVAGPTSGFGFAAIPNGSGGVQAFWTTDSPQSAGRATELLATGARAPGWPDTGRVVLLPGQPIQPAVAVSDDAGGAYFASSNILLYGTPSRPFHVTRVAADGTPAPGWTLGGTTFANTTRPKVGATMTGDGAHGAYLVWLDALRDSVIGDGFIGVHEVRALRLASSGGLAPGWPDSGLRVSIAPPNAAPTSRLALRLAPDGAGGVYIVWSDSTDGVGDLHLQHLDGSANRVAGWPFGGRTVAVTSHLRTLGGIAADGFGGVLVSWSERTASGSAARVIRIGANAATVAGWNADGVPLCPGCQYAGAGPIAADGAGGVLVALDEAPDLMQEDLYASHLLENGSLDPAFPAGGVALGTSPRSEQALDAIGDSHGGAYFTWARRSFSPAQDDLYATRLRGDGTLAPGWPAGGTAICTRPGIISGHRLVTGTAGDAIAVWDLRPASFVGDTIDAYRLAADGQANTAVTGTARTLALAIAPNPATASTHVAFSLATDSAVKLEVFDVNGRRVRRLLDGTLAAGPHAVTWDGRADSGALAPAGVYLVRMHGGELDETRRMIKLE